MAGGVGGGPGTWNIYIYIYVVGTFRVYFVPLRNPIIIEKSQQNLLYIGNISLNRVPIK